MENFNSEINTLMKYNTEHTMIYIVLINFKDQNTYTLHFYEPNSDVVKELNIDGDLLYDYLNSEFLLQYIRYISTIQTIVDKTLIYLNSNHINIRLNYYSRIMDVNEFTKNIYYSEKEGLMSFSGIFYFM